MRSHMPLCRINPFSASGEEGRAGSGKGWSRRGSVEGGWGETDVMVCACHIIALINTYNRMNGIIKQPAGDYQPGQLG
jgi:hypothetical protein